MLIQDFCLGNGWNIELQKRYNIIMLNFLITHSPLFYLTQSLWRDEAYSVLFAQRSISFILTNSIPEPPIYYLILHIWIKLFGTSEIAIRSLSLVGFLLTTTIVVLWAEKLFKKKIFQWFLPLFFFFNPMLLYYAFEARAYSWYAFFVVLSFYAYTQKKWKLLTIANIFGFYIHSYMFVVFIIESFHYIYVQKLYFPPLTLRKISQDAYIRSLLLFLLAIFPWIIFLLTHRTVFSQTWYFPVDFKLIVSVLGNQFLGYEGTPSYLWSSTAILSVFFLSIMWQLYKHSKVKLYTHFFLSMTLLPLMIVIGISLFTPIYVMRYMMPVTIAEIFVITYWIHMLSSRAIQHTLIFVFLGSVLLFNMWYPLRHAKLDIRSTLRQVNLLIQPSDIILATSPLIFFETRYYSISPQKSYLFNPYASPFPKSVGSALVSQQDMKDTIPVYPYRAFLIYNTGAFELKFQTPNSNSSLLFYDR